MASIWRLLGLEHTYREAHVCLQNLKFLQRNNYRKDFETVRVMIFVIITLASGDSGPLMKHTEMAALGD